MSIRQKQPRCYWRALQITMTLALLGETGLIGQSAGQPPSNYKGPTLYGVCVYIIADTSYYSTIFSTSGYFKFKAQEAFRDYATSQAKGSSLKGNACRWSTSQEEVSTQKEADKRMLGLAGRSAKGVETGWAFNPNAGTATPTTAIQKATTPAPSSSAASGAAKSKNAAATPTLPASSSTSTAANGNNKLAANGATSTGSASADTGAPSVTASTKQTMQDSKAAAAASVNDAVATTMGTVTAGATGAMKNLFNRKPKAATVDQQNANAAPAATGQKPAPLGIENTESPQAATAEAQHIEGLVADVAGNDIIINVGLQAGVQVGTKLSIMHTVRTVKDPSTGKVLRTVEDKVGELTIKNADATSAAGIFAGPKTAQVGDIVRSVTP